jgi:hypothetical protein
MFFSRKRTRIEVEAGTFHVREVAGQAVEHAEVVEIAPDGMGIPHVRYVVTHLKGSGDVPGGLRILALSCFAERFRLIDQAA